MDKITDYTAMDITCYATESLKDVSKIIEYLTCKGRGKEELKKLITDLEDNVISMKNYLADTDDDDDLDEPVEDEEDWN